MFWLYCPMLCSSTYILGRCYHVKMLMMTMNSPSWIIIVLVFWIYFLKGIACDYNAGLVFLCFDHYSHWNYNSRVLCIGYTVQCCILQFNLTRRWYHVKMPMMTMGSPSWIMIVSVFWFYFHKKVIAYDYYPGLFFLCFDDYA